VDESEARAVLADELRTLRSVSYTQLVERLLDRQETKEALGPSGAWYQLELQAFWDSPREPHGVLRVLGAIDDGKGWRANVPLTDDFLLSPDGSFIGE
jgi:hypothetical protein